MLHELLLTLTGHSDTFLERQFSNFQEVALKYFNKSETVLVDELLKIAGHYRRIKKFNEFYGTVIGYRRGGDELLEGIYLGAFASSTYDQTAQYRSVVVSLESKLKHSPDMSISMILLHLKPFEHIFYQLSQIINIIEVNRIHGCKILELVHKVYVNAVGEMKNTMKKILWTMNFVFLEQVTHWVLCGNIQDVNAEFFISIQKHGSELDKNSQTVEAFLIPELLPDHISMELAEKMLFIGESILSFEDQARKTKRKRLSESGGIILQGKEYEYMVEINALHKKDMITIHDIEDFVEKIRQCVTQHLCVSVKNFGLMKELQDIKSIFLLGTGELFQAFFNIAAPHVGGSGSITSIVNINRLFHMAGHQVLLDEVFLEKFHLNLKQQKEAEKKDNGWNLLQITYDVQWPLHKIFSKSVQEKYNLIFRFLLNLKRIQHRLQHVWVFQKEGKNAKSCEHLRLWSLRHHMNLLIYNLQYYIQVDVLESQFYHLIQDLKAARDYQDLLTKHHNFLVSLTNQCFLNHRVLSNTINAIIEIIHKFCDIVQSDDANNITQLRSEFDQASGNFFWLLTTLGQQKSTQHTTQLVMRMDYNKYYSEQTSAKRFFEIQEE